MAKIQVKKFTSPDERRPFANRGEADILKFGDLILGLGVYEPGWKWSQDVKPIAGTGSCEIEHAAYVLSGRLSVRMDDGEQVTLGPGDVALIPPGHDAWVEGDEACKLVDFLGARFYAQPTPGLRPEAGRPEARPH